MKIIRNILLSVFVLASVANCSKDDDGNKSGYPLKSANIKDDLDYQLYSLVLNELFPNVESLVINQETRAVFHDSTYIQYVENNYPEIDASVFADYALKNDTTNFLEDNFTVDSKKVTLVSNEELNHIFSETGDINKGWEEFYRRFPDSSGEITFTRIGYNTGKTLAMTELGNMYASLGGQGYLIFLKLENGTWKIDKIIPTWIS
jgi:hypothetical protein